MPVTTYQDHKLITPAVGLLASTGDIESTLNVSSGDLGTVCQSNRINRWAKYKPVVKNLIDTTDQLESNLTWKSSASWWKGTDLKCGLNIIYQTDFAPMCRAWLANGWENFWQYVPPTGGSSAPFRQTDFNYYCHRNTINADYDKPYHTWSCGGLPEGGTEYNPYDVYVYPDDYGDLGPNCYTSVMGIIYKNYFTNPYLLKLTDMSIKHGAANVDMGTTFFGIVLAKDLDTNNPLFSLITSPYNWNTNVPSQNPYDMPAGTDLRWTPQLLYVAFSGLGDYIAFPVCVKTNNTYGYSSFSSDMCKMSSTNTGLSGDEYMIPLPLAPKYMYLDRAALIFNISVAVASTTASTVTWTITITNISDSAADFPWGALLCDHTSFPKTSGGETDYSDPLEQPRLYVRQNGGTQRINSGASVTYNYQTSPRNYNYGYYDNVKIYGNANMGHAYLGVDYP